MEKLIAWLDKERGRRVLLAAKLKIGPSALSQWTQVPADKVIRVEALTGIPRNELRPDLAAIFVNPEPAKVVAA